MSFHERTIAQSIVVVKAMCRAWGITPLSVELVEHTRLEPDAWREVAVKYLTAKAQHVKWKPEVRDLAQELFQ